MHFHSLLSWNCRPEGNSSLRWIYSICDWKWNDPMMAFTRKMTRRPQRYYLTTKAYYTLQEEKQKHRFATPSLLLMSSGCIHGYMEEHWSITNYMNHVDADGRPDSSVNIFIMAANSLVLSCASEGVSEGGQKTRLNGCGYIMNWVASMVVVSQRH